jgi:glycosyltransferase involved in cell wall biosynthesis
MKTPSTSTPAASLPLAEGLSVVVPVYNGVQTLSRLIERLAGVLPEIRTAHEVILVDDGSTDGSWTLIREIAGRHGWVQGFRLVRNFGQHNATLCGVRAARFDLTVTMDQDLQHRPEDLPILVAALGPGVDVIYATPLRHPRGFIRNSLTVLTKRILASIMQQPSVRDISAFRLFRTDLRDAFSRFNSPSVTLDVLLSWGTTGFSSVPVEIPPSASSNYSFFRLARTALLILTGYSTLPLRLASWLGFTMTLFGVAVFIYVFAVYVTSGSLPGFPFLASIIALFSGAQLLVLGVFGEYLAQIFTRSMERPTYVVGEQIDAPR